MRVSQEDSTVKKTHAAMKTVCRRCGGDVSGCGAGYHMVPRAASRASAEARLVLPPNITSPTCGRQSRRRTTVLRLYGMCKPQPGHDAILAVLFCKTQRDARPGCVAGVLYGKKTVPEVLLEDKY